MAEIQIIGIDEINEDLEKGILNKIANSYFEKIERSLKDVSGVKLHIKCHSKGGKSRKWDMRVKVISSKKVFEAQESDWDLAKSLHKVFKNIEREIEHCKNC